MNKGRHHREPLRRLRRKKKGRLLKMHKGRHTEIP
jgi:hypothetical protein